MCPMNDKVKKLNWSDILCIFEKNLCQANVVFGAYEDTNC